MKADEKMNETKSDPGANPEPRRPFWVVGLVLLGLVVAMLGGAFLLDRQLRPSVGIEPATAAPVARKATETSQPGRQPTGPAAGISTPAITATQAGGGAATPSRAQEVEQAYLKYWEVYSEAMYTLHTSRLSEVAAGERLEQAISEVEKLKAQGKAAKIDVEHHFFVFDVAANSARVHDEYVNNSYAIDPETKRPIGAPGKSESIVDTYFLERIDGVWKVVRGVRESP